MNYTITYFWLSLIHTVQGVLLLAFWLPRSPVKEKQKELHKAGCFSAGETTVKTHCYQKKANPSGTQPKDGDLILFIMNQWKLFKRQVNNDYARRSQAQAILIT